MFVITYHQHSEILRTDFRICGKKGLKRGCSAYIPFVTAALCNEFGDTPSPLSTDSVETQRMIESQDPNLYGELSAGANNRKIFAPQTSKFREIAAIIRGRFEFWPWFIP